ncbi:MAG: DUF1844 domain-containing protein [Candidatus Aminicenantes bacterium]|nr:DUF1844 domain-containing protein [Candidatus Aminicenantes bacterium]
MSEDDDPRLDRVKDGAQGFLPPVDFSTIVLPLYLQASIKLGLIEDPQTGKTSQDLEVAKRLIDVLDLLNDRTRGNLEKDEEILLGSCLQQLKMGYLKKTKVISD